MAEELGTSDPRYHLIDALGDSLAGRPVDRRAETVRACELQAMVDHLGRIVEATTQEYA